MKIYFYREIVVIFSFVGHVVVVVLGRYCRVIGVIQGLEHEEIELPRCRRNTMRIKLTKTWKTT